MVSSRLWVIEALASYDKLVDSSVLQEFVEKTPEIVGDLGKDVREMINFRALDTLASRGIGSRVCEDKFDKSESCENVVKQMLSERIDEEEILRSGLQNFITQKRASLPKHTLAKLKDAIFEGKHPALASLEEKSKLLIRNTSGKIIVLDANPNEATGVSDRQTVADGENLTTANVENLNGHSQEDCRTNPNEATGLSDNQTVAEGIATPNVNGHSQVDCRSGPNEATGISDTQTIAEGDAPYVEKFIGSPQEDYRTKNLTPSKRDTSYLERANQVSRSHAGASSSDHSSDTHLQITKKLKQCPSHIGLVAGLPAVRDEQPEALVVELNLDLPVKDPKNARGCFAEIGTSNVAPPSGAHEIVCGEANSNVKKSQRTLSGLPHNDFRSNNLTHEAQHDTDSDPVQECSGNRDGYQDERKDIATKKYNFLSSQCTFTQDSIENPDCTEFSLCMKCEKGGEMLVCSRNACPIIVHQSCLGTAPSFEDNGKFICPLCSYSRALSDYHEIKRKASLIRKDLAVFISSPPQHNKQGQNDNLTRNNQ